MRKYIREYLRWVMNNKYYYNNKYVESIIYDVDIEKKISKKISIDPQFLLYLNQYINLDKKLHFIDSDLKTRIFKIVQYMRYDLGCHGIPEYTSLINEIIIKLNSVNLPYAIWFYYDQANIRAYDSHCLSNGQKLDNLYEIRKLIDKSISYDFEVLNALYMEQSSFEREKSKYVSNGWFLNSINGMFSEYCEMFQDECVFRNLDGVVSENERVLKSKTLLLCNQQLKRKILKR